MAEVLAARARCLAPEPARVALDRAIAILGRSEVHPAAAVDAFSLRGDLRRGKDPDGARRDLEEAIRVVEAMRPRRGGGEGVRARFFGRHLALYERLVRWEVEGGRADRALFAAERGRARVLLDQLDAAQVGNAGTDPGIERRRAASRAELAELRERITFEQARGDLSAEERRPRVAALERRMEQATRSFRELYDEARNASPAWREAVSGEPAPVAAIQRNVVPKDGFVLLYEIGEAGSFAFLVPGPGAAVEALPLALAPDDAATLGTRPGPLTEAALERILTAKDSGLVAALASARGVRPRGIGGLSADASPEIERLHALFRTLVPAPFWARIAAAREVVVVPDGPLFLLPLEALVVAPGPDPGSVRYWLDAGPVLRYSPSATFLERLRSRALSSPKRASEGALSIADPAFGATGGGPGGRPLPRLPGTAAESRAVRAALEPVARVVVLEGSAAREPAVRHELSGKRFLHIATHGLVDQEGGELFAALALAPPPPGRIRGDDDGFLQLFEIYDLRLDAELAVLSACSSNTGRVIAGEGIFALSRGFLVGGARRVVASQWPVDDLSTAELIGDFFARVAEAERSGRRFEAARALRDAKLRVRRLRPEWESPFYWAPFVLTGGE